MDCRVTADNPSSDNRRGIIWFVRTDLAHASAHPRNTPSGNEDRADEGADDARIQEPEPCPSSNEEGDPRLAAGAACGAQRKLDTMPGLSTERAGRGRTRAVPNDTTRSFTDLCPPCDINYRCWRYCQHRIMIGPDRTDDCMRQCCYVEKHRGRHWCGQRHR